MKEKWKGRERREEATRIEREDIYDSEGHFVLEVAARLHKLNDRQKALAKLRLCKFYWKLNFLHLNNLRPVHTSANLI